MAELEKRNFHLPDEELIEAADTLHGCFVEDKADFIAYDTDFSDPYAANFEADIDIGRAVPTDETITDQLQQLTDDVEIEMESCREKFQDSKFFIEKAFPTQKATRNEFGFDDYREASKRQGAFLKFMETFHSVAVKYKVKLIAENYTQAMIDDIKTKGDKLHDANHAQEMFIKNRPVITQERIVKLNKVYEWMTNICKAGKRVYKNNYGKYQRYLLPPGEETPEEFSIAGKVTNSAGGAAEEDVTVSIESLGASNLTDSQGRYGLGGIPAGTYTVKFSKAGLQDKIVDNVVVVDGTTTTLNVVMDPV